MTAVLTTREGCPTCSSVASSPLLRLGYSAPPLSDYLRRFYSGALDTAALDGREYRLDRCSSCGLVYQLDVPGPELLQRLYGAGGVAVSDGSSSGFDDRVVQAHQIELAVRYFGRRPESIEVLDFGAGGGRWLALAAALGCSTTGSEFDGVGLRSIEQRGHAARALADLEYESYDYINTEQVVEHLVEPRPILERLAGALRPGGLLRVSVPNGGDIVQRLEIADWTAPKGTPRSLNAVAPLEHVNCFGPASLTAFGESLGLEAFHYPLRVEVHPHARVRFAVGAALRRVRPRPGTAQLFRRPV